ncbi:hypothetical protein EMCRGX_G030692 [Ephydatia muelleri]|eukprot:Em0010g922a
MNKLKTFDMIVAAGRNGEIGYKGRLPWPMLRTDLKFLADKSTVTIDKAKQNAVIRGRKTWESIPLNERSLKKRFNVVITSMPKSVSGAHAVFASVTEAVAALSDDSAIESIYIFGGSGIYSECIKSPLCNKIYYTDIEGTFEADAFFPRIDPDFYRLVSDSSVPQGELCENGVKYCFKVYQRTNEGMSTEKSTEGITEKSTEGITEKSTEGITEKSTEGSTEKSTEGITEKSIEGSVIKVHV